MCVSPTTMESTPPQQRVKPVVPGAPRKPARVPVARQLVFDEVAIPHLPVPDPPK